MGTLELYPIYDIHRIIDDRMENSIEGRQMGYHYFVKISCFAKFWENNLNLAKFEENFAKHEITNFAKILRNYENKHFAAT